MVVASIMAIVMATSIPFVYHALKREPLNQAVRDVEEVCSNARARAIMQGTMTEVIFHPKEKRFEVAGAGGVDQSQPAVARPDHSPVPASGSGLSAEISNRVDIEMLDVNLYEYKDSDAARVRFYPNGTCDELTLILRNAEHNQWRKIALECTTGVVHVESDPNKFK
jgi:hypothetical protein